MLHCIWAHCCANAKLTLLFEIMDLFELFIVESYNEISYICNNGSRVTFAGPMIMKEDQILITQLNASSMEAFSALYDKYAGMVFNFTLSILKDEYLSEDITQTCFTMMWTRRETIAPDGNVPAWLYVVARNAVFKELRRQVTASKYLDYLSTRDDAEVQESEWAEEDTSVILAEAEAAIAALPESRRKIYKMRFIEGLSVHEISERLDISPKTVETQIARAKNSIRQRVSELLMLAVVLKTTDFL